jgi:hypothetical protein
MSQLSMLKGFTKANEISLEMSKRISAGILESGFKSIASSRGTSYENCQEGTG